MEAEDWIDDAQVAGAEVDEMAGARMIAVQSAVYVRDSGNFGATIKMRGQRFADKNEFATPRHAHLLCASKLQAKRCWKAPLWRAAPALSLKSW